MAHKLEPNWFTHIYTPDMANESWTQNTSNDIAFLEAVLDLKSGMSLLDIACGYGRHAIPLTQKGIAVTAIDISPKLIAMAQETARQVGVSVEWICGDFLEYKTVASYDVIINLYDGGIGYQTNDALNELFLQRIAEYLKPGGQHIMHIPNEIYVRKNFPQRTWDPMDKNIELHEYEWDAETHYMYETTYKIQYGEIFHKLEPLRECKRVYGRREIEQIWARNNLSITSIYGSLDKNAFNTDTHSYISVLSLKERI